MTEPINISEARARHDVVGARLAKVRKRMGEIKTLQGELIIEYNNLYCELAKLEQADEVIRNLLK